MHLIQGTLDSSMTLATTAAGLMAFGLACYGARRELDTKQLPSLLAMTGFVFAAQMVNCATGFGFSGHLAGAALLAILFGPFSAMLSMGVILTAQYAFLGDGSLSTLGANFLNMGVVAPWIAIGVFRVLQGRRSPQADAGQVVALCIASLASTLGIAISLSLMSQAALSSILPAYAVIGGIEAVLSVAVFVICVRRMEARLSSMRRYALGPIAAVCLIAVCLVPLSSKQPDGLEYALSASASTGAK